MLRLTVHHDRSVKRFPIPDSAAVLGSSTACDFVAPFPGVSRRHASLRPLDGGLLVTDLGSKNGLVKDGARLAEIILRPRERVRLGRAWLELEEVESSEAAIGIPMPSTHRENLPSDSSDTGPLTDLPGEGSPAAVLRLIRQVEGAAGVDPANPDVTRAILESGRATLDASALWIWVCRPGLQPSILSVAGTLPSEEALEALAATTSITRSAELPGPSSASFGNLISALDAAGRGLAATLLDGSAKVATWKIDLFDYLASRLIVARSMPENRTRQLPSGAGALKFPEEFVRGESQAMAKLVESLATAARSRLDVLLLGETGTGKELIAKSVHMSGHTHGGPFVAINCAAIPSELLEAQLFGVEARVATGVDPRPGLFVKAEGGSLFLDEIGDLPEPLQAKLLRAIQEREILPLGATKPKKIDVRVISASNKNLTDLTRQGKFRSDLYYRLRGLQFHMPPLRERREDLPALVLTFAERAAREYDKSIQGVSRKALTLLAAYDWPGNIRELKNEVERAVLLCPDGGVLESSHFGPVAWAVEQRLGSSERMETPQPHAKLSPTSPGALLPASEPATSIPSLQEQLDQVERRVIGKALADANGNKSKAARALGITRNGLALKLARLGLR